MHLIGQPFIFLPILHSRLLSFRKKEKKGEVMLTIYEKIIFLLALIISLGYSWRSFSLMLRMIDHGQGQLHFDRIVRRLWRALSSFFLQRTVLTSRPWISFVHSLIAWAFILYMLVNVIDIVGAYYEDFHYLD